MTFTSILFNLSPTPVCLQDVGSDSFSFCVVFNTLLGLILRLLFALQGVRYGTLQRGSQSDVNVRRYMVLCCSREALTKANTAIATGRILLCKSRVSTVT